jgi:hypothetical protein
MAISEINLAMSPHPQMEGTITTLNISPVKLDKFFRRFWDDFLNHEITTIGKHDPDSVRVVVIEIL